MQTFTKVTRFFSTFDVNLIQDQWDYDKFARVSSFDQNLKT